MRPLEASALSGLLWALLAISMLKGSSGSLVAAMYGVGVGPLVGMGIYLISRRRYAKLGGVRWWWSLFTLFVAGCAFVTPAIIATSPAREAFKNLSQIISASLLWVVAYPPLWLAVGLFVLMAQANHRWIQHLCGLDDSDGSVGFA
ncbi:MAG: hypothetical protein AAGG50_04030 [Bacteroidota bacterium]